MVAEALIEHFDPIRIKIENYMQNKDTLNEILRMGNERARKVAIETIKEVKEKVGLGNKVINA